MYRDNQLGVSAALIAALVVIVLILAVPTLWLWPKYRVYSLELEGQARLKEAGWTKQILIEEAKAREQASLLQAQAKVTLAKAQGQADFERAKAQGLAEVERAKATAEANRIIGESLKDNEEYLRYLWIIGLQDANGERIYIPTEAGLPILEAGELK